MIIPYLALARGRSAVTLTEFTSHAESNVWLVERMLGVEFDVTRDGPRWLLRVEGKGVS